MSHEYGIPMDELMPKFASVSCSKVHLRKLLKKELFVTWSEMEDTTLRNNHIESIEYEILMKEKGEEEIERRKTFLGL